MGPIGMQEMIAIFVIALVLFGPKKLPELGRMLGKGLSEFRRAKSELKATFESHLQELERETRDSSASTTKPASFKPDYSSNTPEYSPPSYSYPYEDQGTWETGNSPEPVPSDSYAGAPVEPAPASRADVYPNGSAPHATAVPGTVARGSSTLPEEHPA